MNYQILLENHAAGECISKDELSLIELKLDSQLESLKISQKQGFTEKAPKHICGAGRSCEGSRWNNYFASISDKANQLSISNKSRGVNVINALLDNNYLMT